MRNTVWRNCAGSSFDAARSAAILAQAARSSLQPRFPRDDGDEHGKWRALLAFEHVLHRPQLNDAEGCVSGRGGDFGCVALGGDDAGAGGGRNWMPSGLRQFGGQDLGEFGVYNHESLELDWLRLVPRSRPGCRRWNGDTAAGPRLYPESRACGPDHGRWVIFRPARVYGSGFRVAVGN